MNKDSTSSYMANQSIDYKDIHANYALQQLVALTKRNTIYTAGAFFSGLVALVVSLIALLNK